MVDAVPLVLNWDWRSYWEKPRLSSVSQGPAKEDGDRGREAELETRDNGPSSLGGDRREQKDEEDEEDREELDGW